MNILINGVARAVQAPTLEAALGELGYGDKLVATALNGGFVPVSRRAQTTLAEGDRIEIIAPVQGG